MSTTIRALIILVLLIVTAALPLFTDSYYDHLLTLVLIYSIIAVSLNLYMGFLGGLTLAHTAFFGLAGYSTGLATVKADLPTGLGFLIALGMSIVGAVALGLPASMPHGDGRYPGGPWEY